ncbi:MAG: hypothetical protein PHN61_05535 [Methanothrix sp.]|nr:hypothetical protein [Methanothrix sp.]
MPGCCGDYDAGGMAQGAMKGKKHFGESGGLLGPVGPVDPVGAYLWRGEFSGAGLGK